MSRILLIEDEPNLGSTIQERLQLENHAVTWAKTCSDARTQLTGDFDLILLDVGLPDGSGFDLAKELTTPFIFLTAFADPEQRIQGLELGAFDYISKPFHFKELLLRIERVLKRKEDFQLNSFLVGTTRFLPKQFKAQLPNGSTQILTPKETALMEYLYKFQTRAVNRDEILLHLWGDLAPNTNRTIDNMIVKLRKIIEIPGTDYPGIRTIRGVGYQLELEKSK
jgi:DNA-binding response OmpR family regulator